MKQLRDGESSRSPKKIIRSMKKRKVTGASWSVFSENTCILLNRPDCIRASGRSRKKSQISQDFQEQIREKNSRFRRNFTGIFEASFAEERPILWELPKFCWKAIGFALIWGKFSMQLDVLIAFTQASYRNTKLYFTSKLIEHNKNK